MITSAMKECTNTELTSNIVNQQEDIIQNRTQNNGKEYLRGMLNKLMKIKLNDGRILIGVFLCTDRDSNVILGSCSEYVLDQGGDPNTSPKQAEEESDSIGDEANDELDPIFNIEPRILGLAMVPGKHIVSIHLDEIPSSSSTSFAKAPVNSPTTGHRQLVVEEGIPTNLTEKSDSDVEDLTQKIDSMYT